ncbi:MAG TPA: hypothetical protein VMM12_03890 [Longimicrobiales bacterium]|nr:hypothetical protein [Longimicrobiales bacterium]
MRPRTLIILALASSLAAATAGCVPARSAARGGLPGERRAALATLVVENRTAVTLAIAFVYAAGAGGAGGEVGIGTAGAGERTELVPVPADEPIILIARGDGIERRLPPRTMEIDEIWTWVITADPDRVPVP